MIALQEPTLVEFIKNGGADVTLKNPPLVKIDATKKICWPWCGQHIARQEENGILCFCVGISALIFYGACRSRSHWEICVPTYLVKKAFDILSSPPHSDVYEAVENDMLPQVESFIHTYHCFESRGTDYSFVIVPAFDVHVEVLPKNIVRSVRGVPYPRLDVFAQSCLDRRDAVSLFDLIDGTNVSNEWGEENLDLEGNHDCMWVRVMRQRVIDWDEAKQAKRNR